MGKRDSEKMEMAKLKNNKHCEEEMYNIKKYDIQASVKKLEECYLRLLKCN